MSTLRSRFHPLRLGLGVTALGLAILLAWGNDRTPSAAAAGTSLSGGSMTIVHRPTFRVATFNVHSGVGADGRFDLPRTAKALESFDLVGLNEVRSGNLMTPVDQAESLGGLTKKAWLFAPAERQWWRDHFGNGVLSSLPVRDWKRTPLVGTHGKGYRNVVQLRTVVNGREVTVLVTHLDRTIDREAQLKTVIDTFLALPGGPAILMGDFNTTADDPHLMRLRMTKGVTDCLTEHDAPKDTIDWIFTRGLNCLDAGLKNDGASDHPLAWAEFESPEPVQGNEQQ